MISEQNKVFATFAKLNEECFNVTVKVTLNFTQSVHWLRLYSVKVREIKISFIILYKLKHFMYTSSYIVTIFDFEVRIRMKNYQHSSKYLNR